jgi:L-threonylcarbamoyladenylate synthase
MIINSNNRKSLSGLEKKIIKQALLNSEIIAFPTDTVYGIGVNGLDIKAVKKVFNLKKRDEKKPLILLTYSKDEALKYIRYPELINNIIIDKNWPGILTVIFEKNENTDINLSTLPSKSIGIRIPNNLLLLDLLEFIEIPLVTTSANISDEENLHTGYDIDKTFNEKSNQIPIIIDAGKINNKASTIISITKNRLDILRPGDLLFQ